MPRAIVVKRFTGKEKVRTAMFDMVCDHKGCPEKFITRYDEYVRGVDNRSAHLICAMKETV